VAGEIHGRPALKADIPHPSVWPGLMPLLDAAFGAERIESIQGVLNRKRRGSGDAKKSTQCCT